MSAWTPSASRETAPNIGWLLGLSSWLLLMLVPGPWAAWLGFIIVGGIVRRWLWIIIGIAFGIVTLVVTAIFYETEWSGLTSGLVQTLALLVAVGINQSFLTTVWGRLERGETISGVGASRNATRSRRKVAKAPSEAVRWLEAKGTDRSDYLAEPELEPEPVAAPKRSTAKPRSTILDVNFATESQLAKLPGMTKARAKEAVLSRNVQPFSSAQDFADTIGLQPHEFAQLRERVTCTRVVQARGSGGRRIDL